MEKETRMCIFCCYSFSSNSHLSSGKGRGEGDDETESAGETSSRTPEIISVDSLKVFFEELEVSSVFGNKEDVVSSVASSTCLDCSAVLEQIVSFKVKTEVAEKNVRGLQRQVLVAMKELNGCLDEFHNELKWMGTTVRNSDTACLQVLVEDGKYSRDVVALRERIEKVIQDLGVYRKELDTKINCSVLPHGTQRDYSACQPGRDLDSMEPSSSSSGDDAQDNCTLADGFEGSEELSIGQHDDLSEMDEGFPEAQDTDKNLSRTYTDSTHLTRRSKLRRSSRKPVVVQAPSASIENKAPPGNRRSSRNRKDTLDWSRSSENENVRGSSPSPSIHSEGDNTSYLNLPSTPWKKRVIKDLLRSESIRKRSNLEIHPARVMEYTRESDVMTYGNVLIVFLERQKVLGCSLCNYRTSQKPKWFSSRIRIHIDSKHANEVCGECGTGFTNINNFRKHERVCGRDEEEVAINMQQGKKRKRFFVSDGESDEGGAQEHFTRSNHEDPAENMEVESHDENGSNNYEHDHDHQEYEPIEEDQVEDVEGENISNDENDIIDDDHEHDEYEPSDENESNEDDDRSSHPDSDDEYEERLEPRRASGVRKRFSRTRTPSASLLPATTLMSKVPRWSQTILKKINFWKDGSELKQFWELTRNLEKQITQEHPNFQAPSSASGLLQYNHESCVLTFYSVPIIFNDKACTLQCSKCDYTTPPSHPRERKIQIHRYITKHIHSGHLGPFTCAQCGAQFQSPRRLATHLKSHRGEDATACDICGKPLSQRSMEDHKLLHMNADEKEEALRLKSMKHVKRKRLRRRRKDSKSLQCSSCGKSFSSSSRLAAHEQTHLAKEDRETVICSKCGTVTLKHTMYHHLRFTCFDAISRPRVKCLYCEATLKNEKEMRKHVVRKHITERPFKCSECEKDFKVGVDLNRHMAEVHSKKGDKSLENTWDCEKCGIVFHVKRYWNRHKCKQNGKEQDSETEN